ncbi:hypothetical protein [Mycobacterium sp.]|uniref:hypothetical protein n=1 Tax=Mycobacterium sp. TaxID=1785 RepID=UPI003C784007
MARFEVPDGWVPQAYRFALDPTPTTVAGRARGDEASTPHTTHEGAGTAAPQGEAA